jgi:hypothetical protein
MKTLLCIDIPTFSIDRSYIYLCNRFLFFCNSPTVFPILIQVVSYCAKHNITTSECLLVIQLSSHMNRRLEKQIDGLSHRRCRDKKISSVEDLI